MLPSIEYVKTLVNGLKQWVENRVKSVRKELTDKVEALPQSDWNQNDPEAKDYVKGRVCYTEYSEETVSGSGNLLTIMSNDYSQRNGLLYKVQIGDEMFKDIPISYDTSTYYYSMTCGNYRISGRFYSYGPSVTITPSVDDSLIIGYIQRSTVHPLPDQYIPEWVPNRNEIPKVKEQQQADFRAQSDSVAYIKNRPVYWDVHISGCNLHTTVYNCICDSPGTFSNMQLHMFYHDFYHDRDGAIRRFEKLPALWSENKEYEIYSIQTGLPMQESEFPRGAMVLAFGYEHIMCLNPSPLPNLTLIKENSTDVQIPSAKAVYDYVDSQKFSGSYNDLTDKPDTQPLFINPAEDGYSTTDTAYGDRIKYALLDGINVWYFGEETDESGKVTSKYTKVSWFNIEKTDSEAKLIVGVGPRTDDNSGAVTFAITE